MASVYVNPPRTPVIKGNGVAAATVPNVCKMPGPPAPFVPTPLPNIGKSGDSPKGYSKKVKIEGQPVAIRGASFGSVGDIASKGTGGGVVSSNTHGPTKFIGPGSPNVKIEGQSVHFLGDPMMNNCGPSGSPANSATMMGVITPAGRVVAVTGKDNCPICEHQHGNAVKTPEGGTTKSVAARLANRINNPGMIAVVQCKCDQHYWATSRLVRNGNEIAANYCNGSGKASTDDFKKKIKEHVGTAKASSVDKAWSDAEQRHEDSKTGGRPSHPPGTCAGPKAILGALTSSHRPKFMTERWTKDKPAVVLYYDKISKKEVLGEFSSGASVPPCGTCDIILPLLLCPDNGMSFMCGG